MRSAILVIKLWPELNRSHHVLGRHMWSHLIARASLKHISFGFLMGFSYKRYSNHFAYLSTDLVLCFYTVGTWPMECGTFSFKKPIQVNCGVRRFGYRKTFGKMCAPTSLSMCRQGECNSSKKIAQRSSSFSKWLSFEYWVKRVISFRIHFLNSSLAYSLLTTRPPNLSLVECRTRSNVCSCIFNENETLLNVQSVDIDALTKLCLLIFFWFGLILSQA